MVKKKTPDYEKVYRQSVAELHGLTVDQAEKKGLYKKEKRRSK